MSILLAATGGGGSAYVPDPLVLSPAVQVVFDGAPNCSASSSATKIIRATKA